jgi:hypothetical protein
MIVNLCVFLAIHRPASPISVPGQEPAVVIAAPPSSSKKKRLVLMFVLQESCIYELSLSGKRKAKTPDSDSEPSVLCT